MESVEFKDIDEYISSFPEDVQAKLRALRRAIKEAAPEAREVISYSMPAFRQNGVLVYFAAHKSHIGFYPTSSGITAFEDELSAYKRTKGGVQFPLDKEVPLDIVKRIVKFRVAEDKAKAARKRSG
jgi:uncharacterized protein YdhG (YjbR/CyaY superfamily)